MNWILTDNNQLLCLETGAKMRKCDEHGGVFVIYRIVSGFGIVETWEFDTKQKRDITFCNLYNKLGVFEMTDIKNGMGR